MDGPLNILGTESEAKEGNFRLTTPFSALGTFGPSNGLLAGLPNTIDVVEKAGISNREERG